jgi:hypothetical protein
MKTLALALGLILFTSAAQAQGITVLCQSSVPLSTALITIARGENSTASFQVILRNHSSNQTYRGEFNGQVDTSIARGVIAKGYLTSVNGDQIQAFLQGQLAPSSNGVLPFSINAKGDHRIEFGYGLNMECKKTPSNLANSPKL